MSTSKIFYHLAAPCGGCSGIGAHWNALEAAGIPFAIYAANDGGLIAESTKYKHATLIYRDVEASTVNPADYSMDYDQAALKYWAKQMFKLPEAIKAIRGRVWLELMNEPGKDGAQAAWVGGVMARMAKIALAEGYRVMGPGWSPGTPEPEHWRLPEWTEYLTLCAQYPDRVAVSLHEYSLSNDIHHLEPWLIGRFRFLFDAADDAKLRRPTTFITECGWTLNSGPVDLMADIRYLADLYAQYAHIKFAFLWTLQAGDGNGNLPQRLNGIMDELTEFTLHTVFADPTSPPDPDPIPDPPPQPPLMKYKATAVLVPPKATKAQYMLIAGFQHQYGRSICRSFHDVAAIMPPHNPLASPESEIIVYGYSTLTAEEKAFLAPYNYRATPLPQVDAPAQPPTPPPVVTVAEGVDVSHWQGTINWQTMKAQGVKFAFIRSSNGLTLDTRVGTYAPAALSAGIPYGFYHYYQPGIDPIQQANTVISIAKKYGYDLPIAVDLEEGANIPADYANRVLTCLKHLEAQLGHKPIIYTSTGYWIGTLKAPAWGANYPLWLAAWTTASAPVVPQPWSSWAFWQYSNSGEGADYGVQSQRIDLNRTKNLSAYLIPRKPAPTGLDLLPYLRGDGRMYEVKHPSGATETFQTQADDGIFWQCKNRQWEQMKADAQWIMRGWDTSPGPAPDYAERPGHLRAYHQYETGADYARWCPRHMTVGQTWTGPGHLVQFVYKSDCAPSAANSGPATNKVTFAAKHTIKTWNGITVQDVVELKNNFGESFYYGLGHGLVAWKSAWGESAICEILTGRPPLQRENLPCQ
jgi:lysozyme